MEKRTKQSGVRAILDGQNDDKKESLGAQTSVLSDQGDNSEKQGFAPSMRQSEVRESETLDGGNNETKSSGHDKKGSGEKSNEDSLSDGTSTSAERSSGKEILPTMQSNTQGNEKTIAQSKPATIQAENGVFIAETLEDQWRLARYYLASGMMPDTLNTIEKVLVGMQMCYEHNLPITSNIGKIAVVKGRPVMHSDLPLAIVIRSGLLENHKEEWIMDGDECKGAKCTVKRKGQEPVIREFLESDAKRAGLLGAGTWGKYPKRMYQYRARSWALKDVFPDVLGGIAILEWEHNALFLNDKLIMEEKIHNSIMEKMKALMRPAQEI